MKSKICSKCRIEKPISEFYKRPERKTGVRSDCKECVKDRKSTRRANRKLSNPQELWFEETIRNARDRAGKDAVTIDVQFLHNLLIQQNNQCAYQGCEFNFQSTLDDRWKAPSLDQIIPGDGYHPHNVAICCYRCNQIKSNATPNELKTIAASVEKLILARG